MAKFKKGDLVGYTRKGGMGEVSGPHIYDHTDVEGRAWFINGTWINEGRLFAWTFKSNSDDAVRTGSWDYAEARRLQTEAKAAIEAYNAYVDKKPTDVFFHVMQPFQ